MNRTKVALLGAGVVSEIHVDCVREDREPAVTGEDGRAVLESICAAHRSAGTGQKVMLPFPARVSKPIDLWLGSGPGKAGRCEKKPACGEKFRA